MKASNWIRTVTILLAANLISCGSSSHEESSSAPVAPKDGDSHQHTNTTPTPTSTPEATPPVINSPAPVPTTTPLPLGTKVVWADVSSIFAEKCVSCHGATGKRPLDKPALAWRGKTRAEVLTALTNSLNNNTMPPKDKPQLTDTEKSLILKWVDDGGPE